MSEILRDPLWQFVGAAISLIAIAISILLFYRQRQRKSLAYQVLAHTPILTVGEEIRGKLSVSYENTPVKNVHLLLLKFKNVGNLPIATADFEQAISIRFGITAKLLSHEVVNFAPSELSPNVSLRSNALILAPLLLNPNDYFTIKCLISEHNNEVDVTGRIIGVAKIIQLKDPSVSLPAIILIGAIAAVAAYLFGYGIGYGIGTKSPLLYVTSGLAALLLLVQSFILLRRGLRRARYPVSGGKQPV